MIKSMSKSLSDVFQGQFDIQGRSLSDGVNKGPRSGFRDEIQRAHDRSSIRRRQIQRNNDQPEPRQQYRDQNQYRDDKSVQRQPRNTEPSLNRRDESERPVLRNERGPQNRRSTRTNGKDFRVEEQKQTENKKKLDAIKDEIKQVLSDKEGGDSKSLKQVVSELEDIKDKLKSMLSKDEGKNSEVSELLSGLKKLTAGLEKLLHGDIQLEKGSDLKKLVSESKGASEKLSKLRESLKKAISKLQDGDESGKKISEKQLNQIRERLEDLQKSLRAEGKDKEAQQKLQSLKDILGDLQKIAKGETSSDKAASKIKALNQKLNELELGKSGKSDSSKGKKIQAKLADLVAKLGDSDIQSKAKGKIAKQIKKGLSNVISQADGSDSKTSRDIEQSLKNRDIEKILERFTSSSKKKGGEVAEKSLDLKGKDFGKLMKEATEGLEKVVKKAIEGSLIGEEAKLDRATKNLQGVEKILNQKRLEKALKTQKLFGNLLSEKNQQQTKQAKNNIQQDIDLSKLDTDKKGRQKQASGQSGAKSEGDAEGKQKRKGRSKYYAKQNQDSERIRRESDRASKSKSSEKSTQKSSKLGKNTGGIDLKKGDFRSLTKTSSLDSKGVSGKNTRRSQLGSNLRFQNSGRSSKALRQSQQGPRAAKFARRLEMAVSKQGGEASFSVQTDSGEQMKVQVKVTQGRTDVIFKSDNPAMKQRLERTLTQLKQSLEKAGFSDGDIDIQSELSKQQQERADREELAQQRDAIAGSENTSGEDLASQESDAEGTTGQSHVVEGRIYVVA